MVLKAKKDIFFISTLIPSKNCFFYRVFKKSNCQVRIILHTLLYFSWSNATQYRNSMHLTLVVFFSFCRSGCYASHSPFCKSQSARLTVKDSFLLVLIVPFYVVTSRRVLTIVLSHDSSWDFFVEHELLGNHSSCTQGDFSSWTENQKITNLEIKPEQVQHARKYKKLSGHFNSLEVDNFLVFFLIILSQQVWWKFYF